MRTSRVAIGLIAILLTTAVAAQADWESGVAAFKAGNFDQAAQAFQAVVDGQPDWPGGHYMLGQTLLKQNKNQEALAHLRKAYDLNPNDVSYQLVLGKAYLGVGRYGDAAQLLGGINASSLPKSQQAAMLQMLGVAYDKTGDSDRALQAFSQAAQANPNDASVQFQLGSAALNAGDTATAVRALGKAASLDPGDTQKQEAHIKALIRSGRESRGNAKSQAYQQAVSAAKSLASSQNTYDNLLLLGEAQLGAADYAGAAVTLQQAAAKKPNDWLPLYYVGQAHTATGKYGDAVNALNQSLGKASNSADKVRINKQLGFVYEKQKDFGRAKAAYRAAGDNAAVARVEDNEEIQAFNADVDEEAAKLKAIEEEAKRLEEELKQLPGGAPPPGP
jgi:tetratricopeptide (TPR) repeat protein